MDKKNKEKKEQNYFLEIWAVFFFDQYNKIKKVNFSTFVFRSCKKKMNFFEKYTTKNLLSISQYYRKFPKYSDTQKICCNHSEIWTMWFYHL